MSNRFNVRVLQPGAAVREEIARIESFAAAVPRLVEKAEWQTLRVDRLAVHHAMLVKQLLNAAGGDALITPQAYLGQQDVDDTPALLFGTARAMRSLIETLRAMPLDELRTLAGELQSALHAATQSPADALPLPGTTLRWGERTYIMGIINVTPDSFSRDGLLGRDDVGQAAAAQALRFAAEGADLLDIGGESTRPGASAVSAEDEIQRVVPAIKAVSQATSLPISVDTYRAEVAAAALDAGASIVNDIWGLRTPDGGWNERMGRLVAERGVPIVLMHNRRAQAVSSRLASHFTGVEYTDLLGQVCAELREAVDYAQNLGISRERIIIDPGIGFGKTPDQNVELLRRLAELRSLALPILLGTSRKSFIGLALGLPAEERGVGTAATTVLGIAAGVDIVRVHDVALNTQAARMADALLRPGAWERQKAQADG